MKGLFSISGYFADDKTEFENYLVFEYDNHPEELQDEDIFFYGLSEHNIKEAIKTKDPVQGEFVITSYEREWQERDTVHHFVLSDDGGKIIASIESKKKNFQKAITVAIVEDTVQVVSKMEKLNINNFIGEVKDIEVVLKDETGEEYNQTYTITSVVNYKIIS